MENDVKILIRQMQSNEHIRRENCNLLQIFCKIILDLKVIIKVLIV